MARPKYVEGQADAKQKLVDAFWDALEQDPFEKITVKQITGLAGVNKNTFYYHFETIEDLARCAANTIPHDFLPIQLLFNDGDYFAELSNRVNDPANERHLRHFIAFAGRNGQAVGHIVDELFLGILEEQGGIDPSKLTMAERAMIRMLIGGIKANFATIKSPEEMRAMIVAIQATPMPSAFIKAIRDISKRHREASGK